MPHDEKLAAAVCVAKDAVAHTVTLYASELKAFHAISRYMGGADRDIVDAARAAISEILDRQHDWTNASERYLATLANRPPVVER